MAAHLCDVSTTERPVLMMSRIRFQRNLRALGSIPVVGSSCRSPPDCQPGVRLQDGNHGNAKAASYQEDERGIPDESDGGGKLAFVPSAVGPSRLVCVLGQLQLLQSPLDHLGGGEEEVEPSDSSRKEPCR